MAENTTFQAAAYTAQGAERESVTLPATLFDGTVNMPVMHQAVKAYLANQRQGNASTKIRKYVSGVLLLAENAAQARNCPSAAATTRSTSSSPGYGRASWASDGTGSEPCPTGRPDRRTSPSLLDVNVCASVYVGRRMGYRPGRKTRRAVE